MKTDLKSDGKAEAGTDAGAVRGSEDVCSKVWLPWIFGGDPLVGIGSEAPEHRGRAVAVDNCAGPAPPGRLHAMCLILLTGFCEP